ncbi:MAG: DNRLRE domain-containing protein, partial [Proteobacteria bacterium]|nr:DNRLRE domain-containing protein [Pseudomonadota bacterium]
TLALSNPSAAITLAVITTIGSILGGMLGYFIGLKEGRPIEVGSYDVMLKVVDNNGCLSSDQLKVTVKEGPNVLRLKNGWQGYTGNALCRMWQGDPERNYYPPPEASGWVGRYGGVNRQAVSFDDLFDIISSIPASNNITRAELRLYQTANGSFQGQYGNIQIFALAIPFDPAAVCWNTPWTTPGGYDGGTPLRAVDMSDGQKDLWREWEITSYVQEIRNGTRPDYGFLLKQEDEGVDEVNSWYGHHHYDEALRPELVIHFASPIEADTTAPVISDIVVSNISNYQATITWQTDEPSTSTVEYGPGTGYGNQATDPTLTTTHSITLTGLDPHTTYHFRVRSADPSANLALSSDQGFTTVALDTIPPVIPGVEILNILDRSATIRWSTNEIANSIVDFGQTLAYGSTASDSTYLTSHQIDLSGLLPNTTYQLRIRSSDPSGNEAVSEGHILFTKFEIVTVSFQNGALPSSGYSGCEDATISDDYYNMYADTNYGNFSNIESMRSSEGFLIKWNISSLPAGAIIDSALISLQQVWGSSSSGHTLKAYEVLQDWEELEATWNSRKTGIVWNSSGLGVTSDTAPQDSAFDRRTTDCGSFQTVGASQWCSLTVTPSLVQAWANGGPANYGLFVTPEAAGNSFFYSSEYTNPSSVSPRLTISYHFPAEPQIHINQPPQTGAATNGTYPITWLDHCPEVSAAISLYYDSDDTGYDGTWIAGGISEDDETDSYSWNTAAVPEGTYYVYGKIDDGVNPAVLSCSKGPLTIDHTPPAVIIASPSDGSSTSQPRVSISGTSTDTGTGVKVVVINVEKGNRGDTTNFSFDDVDLVPDTNTFIVTATDYAGNSGADTISIYYSPCPPSVADFTASGTAGCVPLSVGFADSSTGNVLPWSWDLDGDGAADTTIRNPTHTYTTPGTYTVTLTVSGECGSDSRTMTDYITVTSPYIYILTNKTVRNITRNTEYGDNSDGIAGDRVEFRITLTNIGTGQAKDVLAQDTVPAGLNYTAGSITGTGADVSGAP